MGWVGSGTVASSLPIAIAACRPSNTAAPPRVGSQEPEFDDTLRDDGFAAIGTVSQLDETGFLSDKTFQGEQVIAIRNPGGEGIIAVTSFCTHQGCSVEWNGADGFACPCHGSKFNPDGSVAQGPAAEALKAFEAKIEADLVLVKI